jgi:hypothetical protein
MIWVEPTLWGLFGGFAIEALDVITAVRRHRRWPWLDERRRPEPGPLAYGIATVLRLVVGAGVACAAAASVRYGIRPWLAMGLGAAAPVVLEKLTALIPLMLRGGFDAVSSHLGQLAEDGKAQDAPLLPKQEVDEQSQPTRLQRGPSTQGSMPAPSAMVERDPERS